MSNPTADALIAAITAETGECSIVFDGRWCEHHDSRALLSAGICDQFRRNVDMAELGFEVCVGLIAAGWMMTPGEAHCG